jgi:hypothetical protein
MHYFLYPVTMNRLQSCITSIHISIKVSPPLGTLFTIPSATVQADKEFYSSPDSDEFGGFCFSDLREHAGNAVAGHQATSASAEYLGFGYDDTLAFLPRPIAATHFTLSALVTFQRGPGF